MNLTYLRAPALLFIIQAAPFEIRPTDDGTGYRITIAGGGGQYEERILGCAGEVLEAHPHKVQAAGASADYWPAPDVRISAAVGVHDDGARYDGGTAAIQVAGEEMKFGIGFGAAQIGGELVPSAYLRVGSRDKGHFRFDAMRPEATGPLLGDAKLGWAWGEGLQSRRGGFIGYTHGLYSDESHNGGVFGEFRLPASDRVAYSLGLSWRPSAQYADLTGQVGVSLRLGARH
ncbi:MAG: hypothetical protein ABJB33_08820 [Gemmatimonadota bacterium]